MMTHLSFKACSNESSIYIDSIIIELIIINKLLIIKDELYIFLFLNKQNTLTSY